MAAVFLTFMLICVVTAVPSRQVLKETGLSDPLWDNGPLVPPVPMRISGRAVNWCDVTVENEGWFKCADGKEPWCIHPLLKCNNEPDCMDASDEDNCAAVPSRQVLKETGLSDPLWDYGPMVPPVPMRMSSGAVSWCDVMAEDEGWFKCEDGKEPWCIHPLLKCNNEPDCMDASDEDNCAVDAPPQDSRPLEYYCYGCSSRQLGILDHHNSLRRAETTAANMNELHWSRDAELAAEAQALLCRVPDWGEDAHGHIEPDYGQNVARYYFPGRELTDSQVLDMITWWYEEKADYDYVNDACATGAVCGHYTALVSAYLRNVGCSLQKCAREKSGETRVFWNLVCNYSVWPNWKVWNSHPRQPYMQGSQCSKCQPGLQCRNNLCA